MNFLIKKVRTVNGTFGHGWSIKNLADKTPGEMVRASSHHYFCDVFGELPKLERSFGWIACFLTTRRLLLEEINATYGAGGSHRCSSERRLDSGASGKASHW